MSEETKPTGESQETTLKEAEDTKAATSQEEAPKTFTQAELDKIIGERLKREREKLPTDDKLKAFAEWEKAQQTEAEKAAEREKELAKWQADAENLRHENAVIKAGVSAEDADYIIFKVGKMEGDFETNLKAFLADNAKYTEPVTEKVSGTKHGTSKTDGEAAAIEAFRKAAGLK